MLPIGTRKEGVMYQPKRFAISLSAISLYPSAISLSVDVRSRCWDRTAVPPARGAALCPRDSRQISDAMIKWR